MAKLFGKGTGGAGESEEDRATRELMDLQHPRASISDGSGYMTIDPGQVLENITAAMERIDLDINVEISIEEDVATFDELSTLIQRLMLGPLLAVHVVNTALAIMAARYPAELVTKPLPPQYDLRKMLPLDIPDRPHELAKVIFNRRTTSAADLDPSDVTDELDNLGVDDQLRVFTALFYMYGTKLGVLKHTTGIA
ncbi:MAG TPA: hypothetical protein VGH72_07560 [Pseudonocardia sp.]|jgi:hypothetical protein